MLEEDVEEFLIVDDDDGRHVEFLDDTEEGGCALVICACKHVDDGSRGVETLALRHYILLKLGEQI